MLIFLLLIMSPLCSTDFFANKFEIINNFLENKLLKINRRHIFRNFCFFIIGFLACLPCTYDAFSKVRIFPSGNIKLGVAKFQRVV